MVKTFKNLLLQNRGCFGAESLHNSSGTEGLPKLLKFDLFTARSFASLCIYMGKKHLKGYSPKSRMACGWMFAYIIGNGRSTKVHTLTFNLFTARSSLLLYAFVWAPYICMEKMLIISNDFSSEASGPVLLKFHAEPPWAGEWKIAKMGMVHWSKWLPCPYNGK